MLKNTEFLAEWEKDGRSISLSLGSYKIEMVAVMPKKASIYSCELS